MSKSESKIQLLLDNIEELLSKGRGIVNKLDDMSLYGGEKARDDKDLAEFELESTIDTLEISICMCLESLGLTHLLERFTVEFAKFKGNTSNLNAIPSIGILESRPLGLIWTYHDSLSRLVGQKVLRETDEEKRLLFERILRNTPKILKDRNIETKTEKDVRQCVYDLLVHVFPGTIREIPVAQVTKTYKPDIGVPSIKAAAEYKFCDSAQDVKDAVGGLYEDMRGYSGSDDWQLFFAVVYMTDAFFTSEQIEAEFKHTKSDENWKPILVYGKGERKGR